ncbi:hypothetical protein MYXA107069_07460 [Myxococcus xanthus]|nr:hypothetical protein [Myxococcus xanthus]QZZ52927.1 hypothetical protein MyxoNM_27310 [Myxococcus xanthus]SDY04318.1 hypothetical protein SAMN05444383_11747 [Myxococcus xanthus]
MGALVACGAPEEASPSTEPVGQGLPQAGGEEGRGPQAAARKEPMSERTARVGVSGRLGFSSLPHEALAPDMVKAVKVLRGTSGAAR